MRPAFSGAAAALTLPLAVNRGGKRVGHPGVWLAAVAALIYLNQVLFTVYVLRVLITEQAGLAPHHVVLGGCEDHSIGRLTRIPTA